MDPKSLSGIVLLGSAAPAVTAAAAALVATTGMVADLPAAGTLGDPTNAKGGKSKTIKAKDERHTQQRMAITDNLVTYDRVREKFLSSKE